MKVYVWSEMLALFAGKPYSHDLSDLRAHLTNTCQQHIEGTADDLPTSAEEGSIVKLLSELPEVCCQCLSVRLRLQLENP
jgi:hypothetical protein